MAPSPTPSASIDWKPRMRSRLSRALESSVAIIATAASASAMSGKTSASHILVPSLRMARQRLSPSTSRKRAPSGTTMMGVYGRPSLVAIDAARAAMSPKSLRGLPSLATMASTGISFL